MQSYCSYQHLYEYQCVDVAQWLQLLSKFLFVHFLNIIYEYPVFRFNSFSNLLLLVVIILMNQFFLSEFADFARLVLHFSKNKLETVHRLHIRPNGGGQNLNTKNVA